MKNRGRKIAIIWLGLTLLLGTSLVLPVPDPLFGDPYSTVLKAKDGSLLGARIAADGQWRFPDSYPVPGQFKSAILKFEDQYFYNHWGVNPVSLLRAATTNIRARKIVAGGSTITMQLARLYYKNQPRTIGQKIKETWLALRLEVQLSKDELLRLYVNHAPYGGNVVGLPAAAWRYYGRAPEFLSWAEYANLAVLPNAPSIIYPGKNDHRLVEKRNRLLQKLHVSGLISESELALSILEPVPGAPQKLPNLARHLVDKAVADGYLGKVVETTIDPNLQKQLNERVAHYSAEMKARQVHNAAAIIVELATGNVVAYTGNIENDVNHGSEVDIIQSKRSPGSLLKPLLYAMAIDEGLITPWQLLPDIPLYYRGFAPQNFDKKYTGAIPANLALRSSLNVPFVHLLKEYGYEKFHANLVRSGLNGLDKEAGHYGLTLILGGGEVSLWELSEAYASLGRTALNFNESKRWVSNSYRLGVTNNISPKPDLSPSAAWHTIKAMQELRRPDEESNWQRFGSSRPIAWKTGTSYGHKDAWAMGLNSKYVVGVWLGNADGEGRADLVGVTAAAPLMFRVFNFLEGDAQFSPPLRNMETFTICLKSGHKANAVCDDTETIYASKSLGKTLSCPNHRYIYVDESAAFQVNASCYPVGKMVRKPWFIMPPAQSLYYKKSNLDHPELPPYMTNCLGDEIQMEMVYPRAYTKVYVPIELNSEKGRVVFEAAHHNPESRIFWHLNNTFVGVTQNDHKLGLYPPKGQHRLHLIDESGQEIVVPFEVLNESDDQHADVSGTGAYP